MTQPDLRGLTNYTVTEVVFVKTVEEELQKVSWRMCICDTQGVSIEILCEVQI